MHANRLENKYHRLFAPAPAAECPVLSEARFMLWPVSMPVIQTSSDVYSSPLFQVISNSPLQPTSQPASGKYAK